MPDASFPFRLREPRSPFSFPVLVEYGDQIRRHLARNISDSGIFIDADPPYPLGVTVRIVFIYPGSDVELTAIGEVKHHECHPTMLLGECVDVMGVGIAFVRFEDGVVKSPPQLLAS
jgi:hypothetical protein